MADGKMAPIIPISSAHGDRRLARRLKTRLRVDFSPLVTRQEGLLIGTPQRAVASDVSRTGAFLSEVGYVELGTTLHVVLRLPDVAANPVVCYAKVVRRVVGETSGYGIRFLRLSEAEAIRLEGYVRSLKARQRRAAVG